MNKRLNLSLYKKWFDEILMVQRRLNIENIRQSALSGQTVKRVW
jgi:hypothetical protein